jgi:hypothetical protein
MGKQSSWPFFNHHSMFILQSQTYCRKKISLFQMFSFAQWLILLGPFYSVIGETLEDDPESRLIAAGKESNRIFS